MMDVRCGDWVKLRYTGNPDRIPYRRDGVWVRVTGTEGEKRFNCGFGYLTGYDISEVERGGRPYLVRREPGIWENCNILP